jgi:hypothetical protein
VIKITALGPGLKKINYFNCSIPVRLQKHFVGPKMMTELQKKTNAAEEDTALNMAAASLHGASQPRTIKSQ